MRIAHGKNIMSNIRNRIERLFEEFAIAIYDNRYKTLIIMLVIIGCLFSQLPKMAFDLSSEGFLHENDPSRINYNKFRDQFGREELLIIALKPNDIFEPEFLRGLKQLHDDLEEHVPHLDDITSLINARNTLGQGDRLIVEDLLETWPENQNEFDALKLRALNNPMYKNLLISDDGKYTTIVIQTSAYSPTEDETDILEGFENVSETNHGKNAKTINIDSTRTYLTDRENGEVVKAVEKIVKRHTIKDTEILVAGSPTVVYFLKQAMVKDMPRFSCIAVITIAVFLFVMFRRISCVLMPLCIVILSLFSTFGLMAAVGVAFKLPTQILPSFILAVSVGDSVHILVIFFQHFNRHGKRKEAIAFALGHSGLAVLMTSITTAGGLLSFSTAKVAPVAALGQFSAAGVMLALIYTVIFLPALLAIFPIKPSSAKQKKHFDWTSLTDRFLSFIGRFSIRYPYRILFLSLVIVVVACLGIPRIKFSHDPPKWLPETSKVRIATETINNTMKGSLNLEVIIDTGHENALYNPEILNKLENSANYFENHISGKVSVGKAWCITTVLKEINQALHANDNKFYAIPQDKKLVAQEFLLFENSGSDDLEDLTDSQFSKARFTLLLPFIDAIAYAKFIDMTNDYFKTKFPEADIMVTGMVAIYAKVTKAAMFSLVKSYGYAIAIISVLMIIFIGRVRISILAMIPNIVPIIIMLGIMGWFNIPMDQFCMLVGSISIGVAVDDTIHFMHNFRRYFEQTHDAADAIIQTLQTTGRAMLVTSCVLSIGFLTFMFSSLNNLFYFGLLVGITIVMALLSDFFIAPALMVVANKKRKIKI